MTSRPLLPLLLTALAAAASCQTYVAPPSASIEGLSNGELSDPSAPIVLKFSKAIDPATLGVQVVRFDPNAEGQLPDETGNPNVSLDPYFEHVAGKTDVGGSGSLDATRTVYTIKPQAALPIGPELAVLVAPGLTDASHDATGSTEVRKRLLFSYAFTCSGAGTKLLTSGVYFILLNVEEPVGTQIRVFANVDLDPTTGKFVGQFTLASRNPDPNRCSPACPSGQVCQTLPGPPMCVVPSTRAGTAAEWPDFYANSTPPVGFSFTVQGCAVDQPDGTATFATQPANMVVQQPAVTVDGLVVLASFGKGQDALLTATGSVSGDQVVLGSTALGRGSGSVIAELIPAAMAPTAPAPPPSGADF